MFYGRAGGWVEQDKFLLYLQSAIRNPHSAFGTAAEQLKGKGDEISEGKISGRIQIPVDLNTSNLMLTRDGI